MANDFHKNLTGDNNHVIHAFTYADATARTGASGFVSADVGKVAKQTDTNTYWLLTVTTPTWVEITSTGGGSSNNDIVMSTSGTSKPYIGESGTSYVVIAYVHYKGSTAEGTITAIKILASMDGADDTGSIKVYDSTNSLTIAENVNGISGTSVAIYDLGTISNVPTGAAIFEIQVKVSDTTDDFRLSAMRFKK